MKTFQLPANSNYGDRPIPVTFPDFGLPASRTAR